MTGPRDNPAGFMTFAIAGTTISISNEKIPADLIPLVTSMLCEVAHIAYDYALSEKNRQRLLACAARGES